MNPDFSPRNVATCLAYSAFFGMVFFGVTIGTPKSVIWGAIWAVTFVLLAVSNLYFYHMIEQIKRERKQKQKHHQKQIQCQS